MGSFRKYKAKPESYFDINLAPMLDVIVAIVPMLLMSVVFIRVNMIEVQFPQIVAEAIERNKKEEQKVTVSLVLTDKVYRFEVNDNGNKKKFEVPVTGQKTDMDALYTEAVKIKKNYPEIFKVDVKPDKAVTLEKIVDALDNIRKTKKSEALFPIRDPASGNTANTDLMFPEVVFSEPESGV